MEDNIKTTDVSKLEKLSALIASLPESEQEKLYYFVEGIKIAS